MRQKSHRYQCFQICVELINCIQTHLQSWPPHYSLSNCQHPFLLDQSRSREYRLKENALMWLLRNAAHDTMSSIATRPILQDVWEHSWRPRGQNTKCGIKEWLLRSTCSPYPSRPLGCNHKAVSVCEGRPLPCPCLAISHFFSSSAWICKPWQFGLKCVVSQCSTSLAQKWAAGLSRSLTWDLCSSALFFADTGRTWPHRTVRAAAETVWPNLLNLLSVTWAVHMLHHCVRREARKQFSKCQPMWIIWFVQLTLWGNLLNWSGSWLSFPIWPAHASQAWK